MGELKVSIEGSPVEMSGEAEVTSRTRNSTRELRASSTRRRYGVRSFERPAAGRKDIRKIGRSRITFKKIIQANEEGNAEMTRDDEVEGRDM